MEYTNIFEPLLIICLTLCLGILIGVISMLWVSAKELKATNEELDKFRTMYFAEVKALKELLVIANQYRDKLGLNDFTENITRTGALHNDRINERQ